MDTQYGKWMSSALSRDMEYKIYGYAGRPVLFIPCQDGRFFDFENFKMTDTWKPWIDGGKTMIFAIDTIDRETWSDKQGDPRKRIERHEQWIKYITDEFAPFMFETAARANGGTRHPGALVFGCSLGATHAANLYFRRPDIFDGVLALSGIYTASYSFGGYMDDLTYLNSPVDYLAGMSKDHPYIEMYNRHKGVICVGQGAWEQPETTFRINDICKEKGIKLWVDFWGYDVNHDWPWWYKQTEYFLPYLMG